MDITSTTSTSEIAGHRVDSMLVLDGRFDAFECDEFRSRVDGLLADGTTRLGIQLSEVHFIDSSALAELVRTMKRSRELGGDVVVARPSDAVRVIFELTRLDRAFSIVDG